MPQKRRRWIRWLLGAVLILLLAIGAGWLWLDSLFEEPAAQRVASLPLYLGDKSILGIFAHPDDELFVAGLLHDAAMRLGGRVDTVTLTRGEAGYFEPYSCRREDLGAVRSAELLKYGFFLGVAGQDVWGYKDGDIGGDPGRDDEIVRRLVERIRFKRPDLVVTFDPSSGFSMHADHMAAGRLTTRAVTLAADRTFATELGPSHLVRHLAYVEAPRKMMRTLGGDVGKKVADLEPTPDFAIVAPSSIKQKGWDVHESQRAFFRKSYGVPAWLLYALQDKEYYSVMTVGAGAGK